MAWNDLKNAIVKQAADDYVYAINGRGINGKKAIYVAQECESFFRSQWFTGLTGGAIEADWFIKKLKDKAREKAEEKEKRKRKKGLA